MTKMPLGLSITLMIFLASCQADQKSISESQRDAMIDSVVATKTEEISRQASEDLDRRRSIEVKAKADSILAARLDSMKGSPSENVPANNMQHP